VWPAAFTKDWHHRCPSRAGVAGIRVENWLGPATVKRLFFAAVRNWHLPLRRWSDQATNLPSAISSDEGARCAAPKT
jgi:hypothetical protein